MCRETLVSRTTMCLIAVVYFRLTIDAHRWLTAARVPNLRSWPIYLPSFIYERSLLKQMKIKLQVEKLYSRQCLHLSYVNISNAVAER